MVREADGKWLFCNYCGEGLTFGREAYTHVVREHGEKVHVGPGDFDPGRKKRAIVFEAAGYALIIASMALYLFVINPEPDSVQALTMISLVIAGMLGLSASSEVYSRKGEKKGEEIIMDLFVDCDICGRRMALRDSFAHTEAHHPEEHAKASTVYAPMAVIMLSLVILGFAGAFAAFLLYDEDILSNDAVILIGALSVLAIVVGVASGLLFERLYYLPRMERLSKEWSDRYRKDG